MIIEASNKVMSVGHQLDNLATVISFPVADIIADQGAGGNFYVRIQRKGDEAAYPSSNFSVDNGKLNLILTSSDLANVGEGQIQIRYTIGSKTVMSRVYKFYSHFSLDGSGTPPTPWTSWVQEVEDNADRAEEAVEHYPYIDETTGNWMQWDVEDEEFVDTGVHAQGEQGEPGDPGQPGEAGDDGVTFTPSVSAEGIISWTNDGGRENPTPRNIKGPRGSEVSVSNTGTATDEVQYITIDGTEKKIKGGTEDFEQLSNRPKYNGTVMDGDTDIPLHDSSKQDVISDLSNIRSGAALGATALQSVPNTYRTASAQDAIDATKQNVIDDLSTIRSGAALGATALQSVPSTYRTAADQDVIDSSLQPKTDNLLSTTSKQVVGAINEIDAMIPAQASAENQLADKEFTNSSIATNTAHYIYKTVGGEKVPFDSVAELEAYSGTVTQNDYAFVQGTDSEGNAYYDRYKADVVGTTHTWAKEYRLNNSSFTAQQWASIQSGITSGKVALIDTAIQPTDYAGTGVAGIIKGGDASFVVGADGYPYCLVRPYSSYSTDSNNRFIAKGTLENVLDNETIRIDKTQSLSSAQKSQAESNIGISSETFTFTLSDGTTVTKTMKVGA